LKCLQKEYVWKGKNIITDFKPLNQISSFQLKKDTVEIQSIGTDPYFSTRNDVSSITQKLISGSERKYISFFTALILSVFLFIELTKKRKWKIIPRLLFEVLLTVIFMLYIYSLLKQVHLGNTLNISNKQIRVEVTLQTIKDDKFDLFYDIGNFWNIIILSVNRLRIKFFPKGGICSSFQYNYKGTSL